MCPFVWSLSNCTFMTPLRRDTHLFFMSFHINNTGTGYKICFPSAGRYAIVACPGFIVFRSEKHASCLRTSGMMVEMVPGYPHLTVRKPSGLAGPLTWIFIQFGFRRFPLRSCCLRSLLSSPELLLESFVKIPKFTGSDHSRVTLKREK